MKHGPKLPRNTGFSVTIGWQLKNMTALHNTQERFFITLFITAGARLNTCGLMSKKIHVPSDFWAKGISLSNRPFFSDSCRSEGGRDLVSLDRKFAASTRRCARERQSGSWHYCRRESETDWDCIGSSRKGSIRVRYTRGVPPGSDHVGAWATNEMIMTRLPAANIRVSVSISFPINVIIRAGVFFSRYYFYLDYEINRRSCQYL